MGEKKRSGLNGANTLCDELDLGQKHAGTMAQFGVLYTAINLSLNFKVKNRMHSEFMSF